MDDSRRILEAHIYELRLKRQVTYYAASGAGIGFALTQTREIILNIESIPLIAALLSWSLVVILSIYISKEREAYKVENIRFNEMEMRIEEIAARLNKEKQKEHLEKFQASARKIERSSEKEKIMEHLQVYGILFGALMLLSWYILKGIPFDFVKLDIWTAFEIHSEDTATAAQLNKGEDPLLLHDQLQLGP